MDVRQTERLRRLPPFLYTETRRRVREARESGVDVISLGVGEPDGPTPPHIVEALARAAAEPANHRYPPGESQGLPRLREAVAAWYGRRFGVGLDPGAEVLTLIGSKEGSHHIALGLLDPGDVALIPDPGYPAYASSALLAGARVRRLPLRAENGFLPDLDLIPPDQARAAGLMWLNYPNNPTTAVASLEFYRAVVEFAHRYDIVVVSDNPYSEIVFAGVGAPSILEVEGARDVAVEFTSLSKTYNMTGWRIGMAAGNRQVIGAMKQVKENTDSGLFSAVQQAGIAALEGPQDVVQESLGRYRRRRDLVVETLREVGLQVNPPKATFYVWVPIPAGISSAEFAARMLDLTGVVGTPGSGYGEQGEGFVRLSLGLPDARLEEAMRRIRKAGDLLNPHGRSRAREPGTPRTDLERRHNMPDEIRVITQDNELSLEEVSGALPDTSTIMNRVGESWWSFIYAARGGNWELAEYYLRRVGKLEDTLKVLRPKHRERLDRFQNSVFKDVIAAVEARDLDQLEKAYATATDMANALHRESGYPYIKWVLPEEPPKGLELGPVDPASDAGDHLG